MSHIELFMVRAKCGVLNVREALVTDDVDDGVEGGWKVWKEWYVLLIVLVCYAYRLDLFLSVLDCSNYRKRICYFVTFKLEHIT